MFGVGRTSTYLLNSCRIGSRDQADIGSSRPQADALARVFTEARSRRRIGSHARRRADIVPRAQAQPISDAVVYLLRLILLFVYVDKPTGIARTAYKNLTTICELSTLTCAGASTGEQPVASSSHPRQPRSTSESRAALRWAPTNEFLKLRASVPSYPSRTRWRRSWTVISND